MTSPAKIGRIGDLYMELKDREFLIELMEERGISQRTLAKKAGWASHTYLQRLLRGEVKTLNTDPALRIAHYLSIPVHRLFVTRVDTNPEQPVPSTGRKIAA